LVVPGFEQRSVEIGRLGHGRIERETTYRAGV
jgi:hypothetical protein